MLRGLNFFVFQAGLPRLPKDWVIRVFWGLPAFLHLNPKNIEASPGFGAPSVPKYWEASIFLNPNLNKIEASQCFEAPRVPKCWEASIFLSLGPRKDWGLSRFGSPQSLKMLRGLNLFGFNAVLLRSPKDWACWNITFPNNPRSRTAPLRSSFTRHPATHAKTRHAKCATVIL